VLHRPVETATQSGRSTKPHAVANSGGFSVLQSLIAIRKQSFPADFCRLIELGASILDSTNKRDAINQGLASERWLTIYKYWLVASVAILVIGLAANSVKLADVSNELNVAMNMETDSQREYWSRHYESQLLRNMARIGLYVFAIWSLTRVGEKWVRMLHLSINGAAVIGATAMILPGLPLNIIPILTFPANPLLAHLVPYTLLSENLPTVFYSLLRWSVRIATLVFAAYFFYRWFRSAGPLPDRRSDADLIPRFGWMSLFYLTFKRYADFSGRARRREYWLFVILSGIALLVFVFIDAGLGTVSQSSGVGLFSTFFLVTIYLPMLAVSFRRLHDTGRSGWLAIAPIVICVAMLESLLRWCYLRCYSENNALEEAGRRTLYFIQDPSAALDGLGMSYTQIYYSSWILILAALFVSSQVWLLVLSVLNSTPGENKYGPNPRAVAVRPEQKVQEQHSKQVGQKQHSKQVRQKQHSKREICPECGAKYGLIDLMAQPTMCSKCWKKSKSDPIR
jgi:uncharacterized membrane protein YhaH (DUF805 family)